MSYDQDTVSSVRHTYQTYLSVCILYVYVCQWTLEHACAGSAVSADCLAPLQYRLALCVAVSLSSSLINIWPIATAGSLKLHTK